MCFTATEGSPGKHSVAVKHFKRERRIRLLGHIHHILVDNGALFSIFAFRKKKPSAFFKNKKNNDALYIPGHYCFPGRNPKPLQKKNPLSKIIVYGSYC